MRIFQILILLLLPGLAHGQTLAFQTEDAPAATAALQAWQAESPSGWWSWGVTAWDQNEDGKVDLYFNCHSGQGATLLRQGATRQDWSDVTGLLGQVRSQMPSENKPAIADWNQDGHLDLGATGDENQKTNRLNAIGTLDAVPGRIGWTIGEIVNLNGDAYPDYISYNRSFGVSSERKVFNRFGGNVPNQGDPADSVPLVTMEAMPYPAGLPQAVVDELTSLTLPPHSTATANRYASPLYQHVDLNGDSLLDLVIQYGGSYSGTSTGPYKFGRYLLRQVDGSLLDVTATCGIPLGMPLFPVRDATGDGKPDVILAYATTATAGLYQQAAATGNTISFQLKRVDSASASTTNDLWSAVQSSSMPYLPTLTWVDLDQDGDDDLIVSRRRLASLRVFERRGADLVRVLTANHADADGWCLADLNGDTLQDIVTFGSSTHSDVTVKFHINASTPVVDPPDPVLPSIVVKVDGVTRPAGTTVKIDGVLVPLPTTGQKVIEVEGPAAPPVDPPSANYIPITPATIDQVEKSPPGKAYKLAAGVYRPILLKDRKDVRIYGDGDVLFRGRYATPYGAAVVLERCDGVHLEGLRATEGSSGFAIYRSKFCGLANCESFANKNQGIFASFSTDGYVTDCHTHHQTDQHGVYVSNDGHRWKVTGGESHHNARSGIQFNGDKYSDGEGVCRDNLIANYDIHDNAIGINLDGFINGQILNSKIVGDVRFFQIDGKVPSSGNLLKGCDIRQVTTKLHGVMMRDGATNRVEDCTIALETPGIESWFFPISVERGDGSDYTSMGNKLSGRSVKPIGGGTYGKTGEDLQPGDTSTYARVN